MFEDETTGFEAHSIDGIKYQTISVKEREHFQFKTNKSIILGYHIYSQETRIARTPKMKESMRLAPGNHKSISNPTKPNTIAHQAEPIGLELDVPLVTCTAVPLLDPLLAPEVEAAPYPPTLTITPAIPVEELEAVITTEGILVMVVVDAFFES